ncbi:MAG: carboxypeptidase regulatory-like domain-containing protein [Planctomycetota bacterium]|nr:carboxypeptidase regulatory-like domain-containing protein [Planctomycetota bacterium]
MRHATSSACLLVLLAGCACARAEDGTLLVKITDRFETPVANASIKALKIGGDKPVEFSSDASGACKLTLPAGAYGITVRAAGFKPDFTGGVPVRAKSEFPLRFQLVPGDMNEKLPYEKTPEERAEELARLQAKKGDEARTTVATVLQDAYAGLDEALKSCGIPRTGGGPAARNDHLQVAADLLNGKKYEEALGKFKLALGEDPSDAITWFNTGVVFGVVQQSRQAEICFRTAIGLCGGGGDSDFHAYLGRALGRQGRLDEAVKCYKAASVINPAKDPEYLYEVGSLFHSMRKFKEAQAYFEEAIEKKCPEPLVYFACGNAMEMQGNPRGAIRNYREFVARAEKDAQLGEYVQRTKAKLEKLEGR